MINLIKSTYIPKLRVTLDISCENTQIAFDISIKLCHRSNNIFPLYKKETHKKNGKNDIAFL